jgi:hypothetical protein
MLTDPGIHSTLMVAMDGDASSTDPCIQRGMDTSRKLLTMLQKLQLRSSVLNTSSRYSTHKMYSHRVLMKLCSSLTHSLYSDMQAEHTNAKRSTLRHSISNLEAYTELLKRLHVG